MADDIDAINQLAREQALGQISRLENAGAVTPVPYKSPRSSFWDDDSKLNSKYSPSEYTNPYSSAYNSSYGGSPYRGNTYMGTSSFLGNRYEAGVTDTERFYRRTLNAVYRAGESRPAAQKVQDIKPLEPENIVKVVAPVMETPDIPERREVEEMSNEGAGLMLWGEANVTKMAPVTQGMEAVVPRVPVSQHTKHQMTAIVMSGLTRMLSTAVLNWAKERQVPYELL